MSLPEGIRSGLCFSGAVQSFALGPGDPCARVCARTLLIIGGGVFEETSVRCQPRASRSRRLRSYPGPRLVRWLKCHGDEQAGRKLEVKAQRTMKRSRRGGAGKKTERKKKKKKRGPRDKNITLACVLSNVKAAGGLDSGWAGVYFGVTAADLLTRPLRTPRSTW